MEWNFCPREGCKGSKILPGDRLCCRLCRKAVKCLECNGPTEPSDSFKCASCITQKANCDKSSLHTYATYDTYPTYDTCPREGCKGDKILPGDRVCCRSCRKTVQCFECNGPTEPSDSLICASCILCRKTV